MAQQHLSKIQEELGVPQHSIIQAVLMRWNSTLHMLMRMVEQKGAITAYASDHGHFSCLSAEEWSIASNLAETLWPLEEVTLEFSREDLFTSCILPCTAVLRRLLESEGPASRGIQTLRKTMPDSLQKRFAKVRDPKEVMLACVLDPRYKEHPLAPEIMTKVQIWLKEAMETSPPDSATETPSEESDLSRQRTEDPVSYALSTHTKMIFFPLSSLASFQEYLRPYGSTENNRKRYSSYSRPIDGAYAWSLRTVNRQ